MTNSDMNWPHLMRMALASARKGYGNTGPNPLVGALVVRGGNVISSGFHRRVGEEHAEVMALRLAGRSAQGADLVVTLEPCSHFGRTPPCVNSIVEAGISRVVVGSSDPNPQERGRGITMLQQAGVEVIVPVLEERCRRLNEPYYKYITTGRPFVTLKLACSIDGRIATGSGDAKALNLRSMLRKSRVAGKDDLERQLRQRLREQRRLQEHLRSRGANSGSGMAPRRGGRSGR